MQTPREGMTMNSLAYKPTPVSRRRQAAHLALYGREARRSTDVEQHGRRGADGAASFEAMCTAFRRSGGMARGEDLAPIMAMHRQGDYVSLARQIVDRAVLCFDWDASYWLPMFQFAMPDLSVRPDLLPVIWELHDDCDGWALATWFARANARLGGRAPVDLLDTDLAAVLEAARSGRQIETG
jgi:hypothetical protein